MTALKPNLIKSYNQIVTKIIMNQRMGLAVLGLLTFTVLFSADSASADQSVLVYHGKNVIESPPEFAGMAFHFLINNDKATVISAGQAGLEVVRMDITPSDVCIQTQSTLCLDGIVTDVKNPQIHQVGDEISFTIDFANKKQVGTAKSGPMEGMSVTMNIERMNIRSDAPFTLSASREGGFAAFPPKTTTYDSATGDITVSEGETETSRSLIQSEINEIMQILKQSKLLNMQNQNYEPTQGSADYFTYQLTLDQGIFQKEFTWTDTSENVPAILQALQNKVWAIGEMDESSTSDMDDITEIAREFVMSSPTFAFDGMEDTLEFGPITALESFPEQYRIETTFTSSHGGYGDRTDQIVTQVLTPHTMEIIISEGQVISAVTDEKWDELNNQYVLKAPN